MALFVVLSALLGLLVLAVLLRPLWRDTRGIAVGAALLVVVSTVLLYRIVGTPQALDAAALRQPDTLAAAIAQLEAQLQRNPNQAEGWRLLAQAYEREAQTVKARDAYAKAVELAPQDAAILAEAAQARALANDKRLFDGEAVGLLRRALQNEPGHQRARWFLGIAQRQSGDHAAAAATWEPLLAQVDAATAASLRKEIDSARDAAGLAPLAASESPSSLSVRVSLDPAFAARVRMGAGATVFLIAREVGGAPMPVAAEKHAVSRLPFVAILDDGDSLMPTRKLSQLREVELIARLSEDGDASRKEGDVESKPVRVTLPAKAQVSLVIGEPP